MKFLDIKNNGFTLLETMIAMAIMLVAFTSILMVESASVNTSIKSKQMNFVGLLAKKAMIEAEQDFIGKKFDEVQKEKIEQFKAPFEDYKMTRKIKEIKFPELNPGGNKGESESGETSGAAEQITKLLTQFLSKAVREVSVTITWKKGAGEQTFTVSTYWVDLNHDFQIQ